MQCIAEFGDVDCAPTGFEPRAQASRDGAPGRTHRFAVPPQVPDDQFRRLKAWLTELSEANKEVAFSTLLQVWLDAHGIAWPAGVFKLDLATHGSGLLPSALGREAATLRTEGKTWGEMAQILVPDECESAADRERASDKVRLAADAYRVLRERPIEGSVGSLSLEDVGCEARLG